MSTITITINQDQFQEVMSTLKRIEENTNPKPEEASSDIGRLRYAFFKRLDDKTGWGRNELKQAFSECITGLG